MSPRITQGHPTYAEPEPRKGGEDGALKPDGGPPEPAQGRKPQGGGADAGETLDDPDRDAH